MHMLRSSSHQWFWGIVFLVLGIILLLNNFGLLSFDIWQYWPLIFILFGIKLLVESWRKNKDSAGHEQK